MKNPLFFSLRTVVLALFCAVASHGKAQYDTLHIYYHNTAVTPHDTSLAKLDRWIKSLNGNKVDLTVVGYYHKLEFKKFAQERVDEMFLVLNRKSRSSFNIQEMVTKKGKDYQRTTVDLIYKRPAAAEKTAENKKSENKGAVAGGAAKADTKSEKAASAGKSSDKSSASGSVVKKQKDNDGDADKKSSASPKSSSKNNSAAAEKSQKKQKETKKPTGKTETWEAREIPE